MQFDCPLCEHHFTLMAGNTDVYTYTASPEHNFAEIECVGCKETVVMFFVHHAPSFRGQLTRGGINTRQATMPTEAVRETFAAVDNRLTVHELTPRMENEVAALSDALANTPDDLLMDLFTSPPPTSCLPQRWT